MGRGELDEGNEEGQRAGLADTGEYIDEVLGFVPFARGFDACVQDCDDEEEGEGEQEWGFQVLEFGRVEPEWVDGQFKGGELGNEWGW